MCVEGEEKWGARKRLLEGGDQIIALTVFPAGEGGMKTSWIFDTLDGRAEHVKLVPLEGELWERNTRIRI